MLDMERISAELQKSGKADKLKTLAESEDGKAIQKMLDPDAVEKAARSGDTKAMQSIISSVLSTDEGKRLAESLKKAME